MELCLNYNGKKTDNCGDNAQVAPNLIAPVVVEKTRYSRIPTITDNVPEYALGDSGGEAGYQGELGNKRGMKGDKERYE